MGLKPSETRPFPVVTLDAPHPLWRHERGPKAFDEYFQKAITKFIICSYPSLAAPARNLWRLFAVFEDPNEMLEIGWQLSEYPKPRLVFRYLTKSEFDAELASSTTRDDFITYGPPIAEKVFTFSRLTRLITTHGLLTCLVAKIAPKSKCEEYFSTWILTLLGVLLRNEHVDSSTIPKLAARISRTWKRDEDGKVRILETLDPEPVSFSSSIASELRDVYCHRISTTRLYESEDPCRINELGIIVIRLR